MQIGYARVSTEDQKLDLQLDALQKAGCDEVFQDVASGSKSDRAGLDQASKYLRPGDTLVVWKLDRLGRSLKHLIDVVNGLNLKEYSSSPFKKTSTPHPPAANLPFISSELWQSSNGILSVKEQKPALKQLAHVAKSAADQSPDDKRLTSLNSSCPIPQFSLRCGKTLGVSRATLYRT